MAAERDELKALVDSMRSKSTGMGRLFSLQRRNTRKNKKEWEKKRRNDDKNRRKERRRGLKNGKVDDKGRRGKEKSHMNRRMKERSN